MLRKPETGGALPPPRFSPVLKEELGDVGDKTPKKVVNLEVENVGWCLEVKG